MNISLKHFTVTCHKDPTLIPGSVSNRCEAAKVGAAEREAHKSRFATQSTAQLTALYDKMQHDLESENLTDWTVDHKTLVMYRDIIAEILEERKPNH